MTIQISHTVTEGTLLDGTSRGDGSAEALKRLGWRWGRTISCWYLPRSRGRRPDTACIESTRDALAQAGFEVTITIDDTLPAASDLEAAKLARQNERVEILTERAERARQRAAAADSRARAALDKVPPGGEPIKVGHHSEGRHRRAVEKAHDTFGKSVEAEREAAAASRRLTEARATTGARYAPLTVANRITKLQGDIRAARRNLAGYTSGHGGYSIPVPAATGSRRDQLLQQIDELLDTLNFWQQVRAEQIETGAATNYSSATIAAGDAVKIGGQWRRVVRANKVTVSVETGYSWTDKAPYTAIQDHRGTATVPAEPGPA